MKRHADPLHDYDRWYRSYRRRQRIMAGAGWFLAGLGAALTVWALMAIAIAVFGGPVR